MMYAYFNKNLQITGMNNICFFLILAEKYISDE